MFDSNETKDVFIMEKYYKWSRTIDDLKKLCNIYIKFYETTRSNLYIIDAMYQLSEK